MGAVLAAQGGNSLAGCSQHRTTHRLAQQCETRTGAPAHSQGGGLSGRRRSHGRAQKLEAAATAHSWDVGCRLAGCGSAVPSSVLTNKDLEQLVDTNDQWITTRTGIKCAFRASIA